MININATLKHLFEDLNNILFNNHEFIHVLFI